MQYNITQELFFISNVEDSIIVKKVTDLLVFSSNLRKGHGKTVLQRLHFHERSHRIGDRLRKIKPWIRLTRRDPVNQ